MSDGGNLGIKGLLAQVKSQLKSKICNIAQDSEQVPPFLLNLWQNQDPSLASGCRSLFLCNENRDSNFKFYQSACESFFFNNCKVCLNIYVYLNYLLEGEHVHTTAVCPCIHVEPEDNFQEQILFSHHVGLGHQAHVSRFGDQCLYMLNRVTESPQILTSAVYLTEISSIQQASGTLQTLWICREVN